MSNTPDHALVVAAKTAMENAYAPYSKYQVGAAIRAENGQIYAGCNVENAAYPEGTCAEAGAIAAMIAAGAKQIKDIVIIAVGDVEAAPCGGCRQKINEFAEPDLTIFVVSTAGDTTRYSLGEILPHSFKLEA
ncbi:MAG: cytidine deaminase [Rhizobiales bacterium]|nr:cytidine deaminase [Hyphomicrobiales bacterium]NRB15347.1 cytidine deaminase [Hyphomicrobiales bacterium]